MNRILCLVAVVFLVGCVTAETPQKKWDVKVSKKTEAKVWINHPDGAKQCGEAPASLTPSIAAQDLKSLGIMVFEGRTGIDGMMHAAMCGAPTGGTVELQIFESDLAKAQAKGYRLMKQQN